MMKLHSLSVIALLTLSVGTALGQARLSPDRLWTYVDGAPAERAGERAWVRPQVGQALKLDAPAMQRLLERVPMEFSPQSVLAPAVIGLPTPDGGFARFLLVESPVMAPELAAKFPELKTYSGQGVDDPAATVRLDMTPLGFHAQVLSPGGAYYIDPRSFANTEDYTSYYKRDYVRQDAWQCLFDENDAPGAHAGTGGAPGERAVINLRTYRTAIGATGEFSQFYGGTVPGSMNGIVTIINRVTGVYETELAIRLSLIANNSSIVFTDAVTDGYTNANGGTMLGENQSKLDSIIGNANYDIGHVFSTGGGGVANLGVVCVSGSKARGVTGSTAPIGDAYSIDYVAHEMGHQFGANHTFNSTSNACGGGNRSASHAYEPGSGSTIMAYAGICSPDDLQPHSDPYFHSDSLDAILSFSRSGSGNSCPTQSATGNSDPTCTASGSFTIPISTPFALTASGTDPEGNALTYCWEQRNLGAASTLAAGDNGTNPIFRSFAGTTDPTRVFPKLSAILSGANASSGETLPTTNRTLTFRCVARDNRAGGGGFGNSANVSVTSTASAGPFTVTAPNTGGSFVAGPLNVTWNVANTAGSPVNCANVSILLSTDGGNTFPTVLAASTPNDGAETVTLPAVSTSTARIKVAAVGNIFFDICNANFTITPVPPPGAFSLISPATGASGVTLPVTLSWNASSGATGYQVLIDSEALFNPPILHVANTASTSYVVPDGVLTTDTTYFWRVIASNTGASTIGTPNASPFTTAAPPPCPGDLNGDHTVNTVDLTLLLASFGNAVTPGCCGDLNNDGFVNTVDLTLLLAHFGGSC